MRTFLTALSLTVGASLAAPAMAASLSDGKGYALGPNGASISVIGDLSSPVPTGVVNLTDGSGNSVSVDAIAFRPNTKQFYGYADANDTVYQINVETGVSTIVAVGSGTNASGAPIGTTTGVVGFDFNNQLDAARVVSANNENLVFFPATGTINRFTDLFYGDGNAGTDPNVFANAYTNAVPLPSSTQQYVIDSELDVLATLANNAGTLVEVGSLGLDVSEVGGFDILSLAEGDNLALALLTIGGVPGDSSLYTIDLLSGAASLVGAVGPGFTGFAVAPIPLPASGLLLLVGIAGAAAASRRRS